MKEVKKYIAVWWRLTIISLQVAFASRLGTVLFTIGKLLRFGFFLFFLLLLMNQVKNIAGYTYWEMVFFFATYNMIDVLSQVFLREVYRFRWYVASGQLDFFLAHPFSLLFRSLFGGTDILDIPMLVISLLFVFIAGIHLPHVSSGGIVLYGVLVINALILALAFHIAVLGIGILTTEVDNTIMLYRDVTQMGRIPVDIYQEPVRAFLTFFIPVGVIMTFPAKALMGILSIENIIIAFILSGAIFYVSLYFWKYSLRFYTSASS